MPFNGNSLKVDPETGFLSPSKNYSLTGFDAHQKTLALKLLREKLNVGKVCKAIGINRTHFFRALQSDPEFMKAYREVQQEHLDDIVDTMYDRAKKPNGTVAGIFLLKTKRPNEYGDRTVIEHQTKTTADQALSWLKDDGRIIDVESASIEADDHIIPALPDQSSPNPSEQIDTQSPPPL